VTASYGPLIFTCYDVPDLPRTHNDLEQMFGGLRHQLRRATGQKNAPASWVVCGATRLPPPNWPPPTSSSGGPCAPAGNNAAGPGCGVGGFGGIQMPICKPWQNA
jgi:hypothetical protein